LNKTIKKELEALPYKLKKFKKLSEGQKSFLKATLVSASTLSLFGCPGGGGGDGASAGGFVAVGPRAARVLTFNPIADVTVKPLETVTLNPSISNPDGRPLTFTYADFMGQATKQVQDADVGVHYVEITVTDGILTSRKKVKIIVYTGLAIDPLGLHLARRITFGMTPTLYKEIDALGSAQNFLNQQLNPAAIDDSNLQFRMIGLTTNNRSELKSWTLMQMTYSNRQLLEVMTWFWDNHFNTDINSLRGNNAINAAKEGFERTANEEFRTNALGNFRQLLGASAKSPSMLLYLNSVQNRKRDSNENYARELLELHTMGVDGGYVHGDVEAGAEIFTGWHLRNLSFFFNTDQHNFSAQQYLGVTIPSGGVAQGEQVLDLLAAHPSTATFICTKLVTLLVNDVPPQALITRCANLFNQAVNDPDQIAQVLRIILTSTEFNDPTNKLAKIKTPVEFATSVVRVLEGESTGNRLQRHIESMGMDLYENLLPTGWSEKGVDWMSSGVLLERMKTVEYMLRVNNVNSMQTDLLAFFPANGANTADEIVDFLLIHLLGEYPALARTNALTFLLGANGFNLADNDARIRLQRVVEIIMCYPQFQYQ